MADTPYRDVNMGIPSPMLGGGFDPQAFWQNYGQRKQNLVIRNMDREARNKAAWMKEYDPTKLIPKEIYDWNKEEVAAEIDALTEEQATAATTGKMPKGWAQRKANINQLANEGKFIQDSVEGYAKMITQNPEKFNPTDYNAWMEGLKKQKGVKAMSEYVKTTQPFKEQVDIGEVFSDWIGDESTFEQGATTTTKLDPVLLKERMNTRFMTMPPQKQKATLESIYTTIDPATGKPVATNYGEALDYVTKMMLPMGSVSVTKDEPPKNNSNNSDGGGDSKSKLLISGSLDIDENHGLGTDGVSWNRVSVKRAGTNDDLPPTQVYSDEKDDKGNNVKIEFQPIEFVMGKNGKIGVSGVKITRVPTMNGTTTEKRENTWVDYDLNKDAFESQLEDRSMYDIMREQREAQGDQPATPAQNTATGGSGVTWKTAK